MGIVRNGGREYEGSVVCIRGRLEFCQSRAPSVYSLDKTSHTYQVLSRSSTPYQANHNNKTNLGPEGKSTLLGADYWRGHFFDLCCFLGSVERGRKWIL